MRSLCAGLTGTSEPCHRGINVKLGSRRSFVRLGIKLLVRFFLFEVFPGLYEPGVHLPTAKNVNVSLF
jgi:hypothetical protein